MADSRLSFSDNVTGLPIAYADGLDKIISFDRAILAETGQGFMSEERFDLFVHRFAESSGSLPVENILPALLEYAGRRLPAEDYQIVARQHMAVAKFRNGKAVICGYDGRMGPCIDRAYIQSSPTDFEKLLSRLPHMTALETASEARASMERYIETHHKSTSMGGEFQAVLLTPDGTRQLWPLRHRIEARTIDELIALVTARRLPVTLIPPATWDDLRKLLE
ncbi:MAG: hypothetical protein JO323_08765 [Acidobacteriia bacterium]|nr:hypothetical protein [Terriglobia bacterium]